MSRRREREKNGMERRREKRTGGEKNRREKRRERRTGGEREKNRRGEKRVREEVIGATATPRSPPRRRTRPVR